MILGISFLFGLVVGSFLNVCIVRIPEGQSIVFPPSRCPRCREPIRWYDNIPVVSFFLLRGRCRACGLPISLRYPLVEFLSGLLFVFVVREFGLNGEGILILSLCSALLAVAFIDLDHMIIPDVITIPGMIVGLTLAPFFMASLTEPLPFHIGSIFQIRNWYLTALLNSFMGLVAGGGPLWLIGMIWEKIRKVEAMGGGDVKLMGMVGSMLGWQAALTTIMLAAASGAVVGVMLIIMKKHESKNHIPFGPFLAFGAVLSMFFGADIRNWYFGIVHL